MDEPERGALVVNLQPPSPELQMGCGRRWPARQADFDNVSEKSLEILVAADRDKHGQEGDYCKEAGREGAGKAPRPQGEREQAVFRIRQCLWVSGSGASPAFQGWTTAGPSLLYPLRGASAAHLLCSSCSRTYPPRTPLNSSPANPVREQMRLACH